MNNLALKRIRSMEPYSPPLDGRTDYGGLLLDFNERTVGRKEERLYPEYSDLTQRIATYANVRPDQVMATNGTDQAIDVIFRTFSDRGDQVIIPAPTFAMYEQYARLNGNRVISPTYRKNSLAFPVREVVAATRESVKIIVICNPNNPTGTSLSVNSIASIARSARRSVVYVDEAYYEFSGITATDLLKDYPNIVISRTFSKAFGLAGMRIGYIIANSEHITEMLKVRGPYDINRPACRVARKALSDVAKTKDYADQVMSAAKPLVERFFKKNGITFYPSAANFILFKPYRPEMVAETLRREGIAVRRQDKPGVQGCLRVSIGTEEQMRRFITVYDSAILSARATKYAIIDRDGTLIREPRDTQVDSLRKFRVLDGAIEGLQLLQERGYRLLLATNQDGLGTESFPRSAFSAPHAAMLESFRRAGIRFDAIRICPHLSTDDCTCRKPRTGLIDTWSSSDRIDRERSFVCGDRATDKEFADNLGLRFVPMTTNGNFLNAIRQEVRDD